MPITLSVQTLVLTVPVLDMSTFMVSIDNALPDISAILIALL